MQSILRLFPRIPFASRAMTQTRPLQIWLGFRFGAFPPWRAIARVLDRDVEVGGDARSDEPLASYADDGVGLAANFENPPTASGARS